MVKLDDQSTHGLVSAVAMSAKVDSHTARTLPITKVGTVAAQSPIGTPHRLRTPGVAKSILVGCPVAALIAVCAIAVVPSTPRVTVTVCGLPAPVTAVMIIFSPSMRMTARLPYQSSASVDSSGDAVLLKVVAPAAMSAASVQVVAMA